MAMVYGPSNLFIVTTTICFNLLQDHEIRPINSQSKLDFYTELLNVTVQHFCTSNKQCEDVNSS